MASMNLKTLNKQGHMFAALLIGVVMTVALIVVYPISKAILPYGTGLLAAWILDLLFWGKLVGKDIKYRRRPVLVPVILVLALNALFLLPLLFKK